jgi:hypothetical protein
LSSAAVSAPKAPAEANVPVKRAASAMRLERGTRIVISQGAAAGPHAQIVIIRASVALGNRSLRE